MLFHGIPFLTRICETSTRKGSRKSSCNPWTDCGLYTLQGELLVINFINLVDAYIFKMSAVI